MDGAFLVSFDVATKKAYTSVAVKMSTKELSVLAQPGGTFYGVDKMDNGKIVIFGGGVPLKVGDTIIGGLGISGSNRPVISFPPLIEQYIRSGFAGFIYDFKDFDYTRPWREGRAGLFHPFRFLSLL